MTQEKDKPWSDTTILVKMAVAGFDNQDTVDHKYHIHEKPVSGDANAPEVPCISTGGHWNPYDVSLGQ